MVYMQKMQWYDNDMLLSKSTFLFSKLTVQIVHRQLYTYTYTRSIIV